MIYIVLVEPENDGNCGAIARVMKNFSNKNLILINPKCNHLSDTALNRAKHAKEILKKAKVMKKISSIKVDYLIGTTSQLGTDYNIPRLPLTPQQFAEKINQSKKIAILFGRESSGLNNKEIEKCDFVVTIPTSKEYPTMNISNAVTIILYEIFKKFGKEKINEHIRLVSKKDKDVVLNLINKTLNQLHFTTKQKKETQKKVWKKVIGKSFLTKREAFALCGFFKKIISKKTKRKKV